MFKKLISVIVIAAMCLSLAGMSYVTGAKDTDSEAVTKNLDEYMSALQSERNFHGSVLVAKDGKILLEKGYGMADMENKLPNDKDTRFAIGSVTKQFTAMAIMQLYEKGKLKLNDRVSKYIPDFKDGNKITIHHLLTHSSGIYNVTDLPEFYSMKSSSVTLDSVIKLFKNRKLNFEPGTKFEYSNSGYILLTYIIEKASKMRYDKYLDKYIFLPLGMKNTGDCYQNNKYMLRTRGYTGYLETKPVNDTILRGAFGAGELYSTVGDLYKWDRALYTEKLLKKANIKKMFEDYQSMTSIYSYGYGFAKRYSEYGYEIMHTGGTLSFTSILSRFIDKDITVIALVNNVGYDVVNLRDNLMSIVFGQQIEVPKNSSTLKIDQKILDAYAGSYDLGQGLIVYITSEDGHLYAQLTGQEKYEIFPNNESSFYYKVVEAQIEFNKNTEGKVDSLTLKQSGMTIKGVKK